MHLACSCIHLLSNWVYKFQSYNCTLNLSCKVLSPFVCYMEWIWSYSFYYIYMNQVHTYMIIFDRIFVTITAQLTDTPEKLVLFRFHRIRHPIFSFVWLKFSRFTNEPGKSSQFVGPMFPSLTMVIVLFSASARIHRTSWIAYPASITV